MPKNYVMYEIKKWLRDPLLSFLLLYPIILSAVVRFGVPYAEKQFHFSLAPYYHIVIAVLMLMTALLTGAIIGFSILDDRDDKILYAVDVSPVSFNFFMGFRFFMSFVLTLAANLLSILIANLISIPFYAMLLVSVSVSLFSSIAAMAVNCLATNKIEGFAMMKATGLIIVLPIASMFFTDFKEFFFSFEPNFWSVKALSVAVMKDIDFNWSFWGYYAVGILYVSVLNLLVFRLFKRRIAT